MYLSLSSIAALSFFLLAMPVLAANEIIPTAADLTSLQQRASQARPSEQCFLYSQMVHGLTQKVAAQIAADDSEHANATIHQIDQVVSLIQHNLTRDSKHVKDSELLLQDTTNRLIQMLQLLDADDQAMVQKTLKQIDNINDQLLTQVFTH